MSFDKKYKSLVGEVKMNGYDYEDPNREGVIRKQIDSYTLVHNFDEGFPVLSLRKLYYKTAFKELAVFLSGSSDIRDLWKNGINFWDKDYKNFLMKRYKVLPSEEESVINLIKEVKKSVVEGKSELYSIAEFKGSELFKSHSLDSNVFSLGNIYPKGMRSWGNSGLDQIKNLIDTLKTNPMATKKTVVMYNPELNDRKALTECHWAFEALVSPLRICEREELADSYLTEELKRIKFNEVRTSEMEQFLDKNNIPKYGLKIKWHQHSVDTFLGLPTNVEYYSALTYVLSYFCNMKPVGIIGDLSNVHLYDNSFEEVEELLNRESLKENKPVFKFPKLDTKDFDIFCYGLLGADIEGYHPHPPLKVEMLEYTVK